MNFNIFELKYHKFFYSILFVTSLTFLILTGCSNITDKKTSKYAIVFGISEYNFPMINLSTGSNDADTVAKIFSQNNYEVIKKKNKNANIENLKTSIKNISNKSHQNDIVVFYFSGHGLDYKFMRELSINVEKNWYGLLLANDTSNSQLKKFVESNVVSNENLYSWFKQIKATKILIFDACFSGGFVKTFPSTDKSGNKTKILKQSIKNYNQAIFKNSSHPGIILSSTGKNEASWDGFYGNSVFTYFFKHGADSCDINNDGNKTILEMYTYIKGAMNKYWNNNQTDSSRNFLPRISAHPIDIILFSDKSKNQSKNTLSY